MARTSIYGDRDPADVAAYSLNEAAALVGVPRGTLRSWVWGRSFTTKAGARRRSPAIITTPDARFLSFTNVVEAHVIAALRKEHKIKLYKIRSAVRYMDTSFNVQHALAREKFKTDGLDLFVERLGAIFNVSCEGQVVLREAIKGHLARVEYAKGTAVRFFPLLRDDAPRAVVVDPKLAFGRPVLVGTAIPIADIASRFQKGDDVVALASDYEVTVGQIQEALRAARVEAA